MKQDYVLRGRGYVDRVGCIMAVCEKCCGWAWRLCHKDEDLEDEVSEASLSHGRSLPELSRAVGRLGP